MNYIDMIVRTITKRSLRPKYRKIYKYCKELVKDFDCLPYSCRLHYDIKRKIVTIHIEENIKYYLVVIKK